MALTKEDLEAIKGIIKAEIKAEVKPLALKVDALTVIVTNMSKSVEGLMKFVATANADFDPLKKKGQLYVHKDHEEKKEG